MVTDVQQTSREQPLTAPLNRLFLVSIVTLVVVPLAAIAWFGERWQKAASTLVLRFENDPVGKLPKLFTSETGQWQVTQDGENRALAQTARNGTKLSTWCSMTSISTMSTSPSA